VSDRRDHIAMAFGGCSKFWWVIMIVNCAVLACFFFIPFFNRYKFFLFQVLLLLLLFFRSGPCCLAERYRSRAGWLGNFYTGKDALLVTLDEPLVEKQNLLRPSQR
jgi:hypothetical protein